MCLRKLELRRKPGTNTYWLVDMHTKLPILVACDGERLAVKMVLKIYRKLGQKEAKSRDNRRKYPIILSESPAIL